MGSFTSITYSGDLSGQLVKLVFNDGNFVGYANPTASTSDYVSAGGNTFADTVQQFNANVAFTNYIKSDATVSTIKTGS